MRDSSSHGSLNSSGPNSCGVKPRDSDARGNEAYFARMLTTRQIAATRLTSFAAGERRRGTGTDSAAGADRYARSSHTPPAARSPTTRSTPQASTAPAPRSAARWTSTPAPTPGSGTGPAPPRFGHARIRDVDREGDGRLQVRAKLFVTHPPSSIRPRRLRPRRRAAGREWIVVAEMYLSPFKSHGAEGPEMTGPEFSTEEPNPSRCEFVA